MRCPAIRVAVLALLAFSRSASADPVFQPRPPALPPLEEETTTTPEPSQSVLEGATLQGGYAAPQLVVTSVAQTPAMLGGLEGGWILAHRFVLGGAVYGLATNVDAPAELQPANGVHAHVSMLYGGLRFGTIVAPTKLLHLHAGVLVGGGAAGAEASHTPTHAMSSFFVVQPDVALELNVARYVRLSNGVGWRFSGGSDAPGLTATALGGPIATIKLELGAF